MRKLKEGEAIYCESKEDDVAVREILHAQGFKWGSGVSLKDKSMFTSGINCLHVIDGAICADGLDWLLSRFKTVINAKVFISENRPKHKFNLAIHTPTEKDYRDVTRILERKGYYWDRLGDAEVNYHHWDIYKDKTCINVSVKQLGYAGIEFYQKEKFQIVPASAFIYNNPVPGTLISPTTTKKPILNPFESGKKESKRVFTHWVKWFGFDKRDIKSIYEELGRSIDETGTFQTVDNIKYDRNLISAILAMSKGRKAWPGEYVTVEGKGLRKVYHSDKNGKVSVGINEYSAVMEVERANYRKATVEQIMKHFERKAKKKEVKLMPPPPFEKILEKVRRREQMIAKFTAAYPIIDWSVIDPSCLHEYVLSALMDGHEPVISNNMLTGWKLKGRVTLQSATPSEPKHGPDFYKRDFSISIIDFSSIYPDVNWGLVRFGYLNKIVFNKLKKGLIPVLRNIDNVIDIMGWEPEEFENGDSVLAHLVSGTMRGYYVGKNPNRKNSNLAHVVAVDGVLFFVSRVEKVY